MMAAVSEMAGRVGESAFGRYWGKAGDFLDCAIPIALVTTIIIAMGMVAFGAVQ
jgi:hypothetical protein